ncbi:MAG TPA: hypothetical protein VMF31_14580 [Solirubrobacterales bacterium]|nr:hypothetical protein [Solirubrobacterales bacterium]
MDQQLFELSRGQDSNGRDVDVCMALEIAEFVADRAQYFVDHECRAWALTDFGVWAVLGGRTAKLSLEPLRPEDPLEGRLGRR